MLGIRLLANRLPEKCSRAHAPSQSKAASRPATAGVPLTATAVRPVRRMPTPSSRAESIAPYLTRSSSPKTAARTFPGGVSADLTAVEGRKAATPPLAGHVRISKRLAVVRPRPQLDTRAWFLPSTSSSKERPLAGREQLTPTRLRLMCPGLPFQSDAPPRQYAPTHGTTITRNRPLGGRRAARVCLAPVLPGRVFRRVTAAASRRPRGAWCGADRFPACVACWEARPITPPSRRPPAPRFRRSDRPPGVRRVVLCCGCAARDQLAIARS